jgi:DNA helicase-2/ATP-dependent DNA helicase PcrA
MGRGSLFDGLNESQREAVEATEGPVLILAGAGTGKTRTVTYRMARLLQKGIPPEHILAVTFTNKAATEMRERVGGLVRKSAARAMTVCTFHSLCVRILRQHIGRLGYKTNFSIAVGGDQQSLLKQLIVQHGATKEGVKPGDVISEVSRKKNAGLALGDIEDDLLRTIAMSYQRELRARNALDFDDLLLLAEQVLREHKDARNACRAKYRYVTVDEFQDTNGLQMDLLMLLVGPPHNVCVVGDDDQSIYGWRGAQVSNILGFDRFFKDPHVVRLEDNYRSTEAILRVANKLIAHNPARHDKMLRPTIMGGDKVVLMRLPGDDEEAGWVADEIKQLRERDRRKWEDFAVLFRTNTQIRRMEQAMRESDIPYRLVGAQSFYDRREVKDVLAYLQMAENPAADVAMLRILNTPPRGIASGTATLLLDYSRELELSVWDAMWDERFLGELSTKAAGAVRKFAAELAELHDAMKSRPRESGALLRAYLDKIDYISWLMRHCKTDEEKDQRREAIGELVTALADAVRKGKTLQEFLDSAALDAEPEEDDLDKKAGVTLITLHAAKGLEFPVVFLVGIEDGILPHKRSIEEGTRDEERRLFYVGITRAQKQLFISYCGVRKKWGQLVHCDPSSFLIELDFDWIEEADYEEMMNAEASDEDVANFLGDMREMLK